MSHALADVYRRRAQRLRRIAAEMTETPGLRLHIHAGVDTWRGPRPLAHVDDLRRAQDEVRREIAALHERAIRFDHEADRLDALAHAARAAAV